MRGPALSLFAAIASLLSPIHASQAERPPNVVFLLADDLGWSDLGCYGSSFYETPHLDRLATEGVRFTQAYAACPVCSPTRASILTGRYPARLHNTDYFGGRRRGRLLPAQYDEQLALEEVTLAEALRAAGYATAFFGKWHLGGEGYGPLEQGFDSNVAGYSRGMPPQGYFAPWGIPTLAEGQDGEHLTERLTDAALSFLDQHASEPFLLYLSYYAVHTPLQTKPELRKKYEAKRAALPEQTGPHFAPEEPRRARQVQDHAVYAGMVESLDTSVGRVLRALDEAGLRENTIVVFTSDNGGLSTSEGSPTSNLPLRAGKGWLYEGGIREPLIVRWPGRVAGNATCEVPVISNDCYPTLLEACGLDAPPAQHLDGVSLVPLLADPEAGVLAERALYWHYPHYGNQGGTPSGAVRAGAWKLIEFFETDRVELYDLSSDLAEQHDLAAQEQQRAADMREALHAWRARTGARMPTPNPDPPRARLHGSVRLIGELPSRERLLLDDAMRELTGTRELLDEAWLFDEKGGLANCVLTLAALDQQLAPAEPLELTYQKIGPRYVPRILVAPRGSTIRLHNVDSPCRGFMIRDPFVTLTRSLERGKSVAIDLAQVSLKAAARGHSISISCDLRDYMRGAIYCTDSPHWAKTGADGSYELTHLLPGRYRLQLWHERLGLALERELVLEAGRKRRLDLEFEAPQ